MDCLSLKKMEVLWVGQQNKDLDIRLDMKKLYIWVERFAGTAAWIWKFAGEHKSGRMHGGKWKG